MQLFQTTSFSPKPLQLFAPLQFYAPLYERIIWHDAGVTRVIVQVTWERGPQPVHSTRSAMWAGTSEWTVLGRARADRAPAHTLTYENILWLMKLHILVSRSLD